MPVFTGGRWTDNNATSSGSYAGYSAGIDIASSGGVVTWSIVGAGHANHSGDSGWFTGLTVALADFLPATYETILRQAFDAWSSHANIEFIQIEDDGSNAGAGTDATIRIAGGYIDGDSGANTWGYSWFPWSGTRAGDIMLDSGNTSFTTQELIWITMHEIGHSLGLNHAAVGTVMNGTYSGVTALQPDDINGITALYGAQDGEDSNYYMAASQQNVRIIDGLHNLHIYGNAGNNEINGTGEAEVFFGAGGDDTLFGWSGQDTLNGGDGSDSIRGGNDNDLLLGRSGADVLSGNLGDDRLYGGAGNDRLFGGGGNDKLNGGSQDDRLNGGIGNDTLRGDNGNDLLLGRSGADVLSGGDGADRFYGGAGNDRLFGGNGDDDLKGGSGDDDLYGGLGDDSLTGNSGADTFVFKEITGTDTVQDFEDGTDLIQYKGGAFVDLTIVAAGANVDITATGGGHFVLLNTDVADITADDFIFS